MERPRAPSINHRSRSRHRFRESAGLWPRPRTSDFADVLLAQCRERPLGEVGEPLGPVCLKILDRAVGQIGPFVGEPTRRRGNVAWTIWTIRC